MALYIGLMGTTQDLEDTVYSPRVKCGSQRNHWLFTALLLRIISIVCITRTSGKTDSGPIYKFTVIVLTW